MESRKLATGAETASPARRILLGWVLLFVLPTPSSAEVQAPRDFHPRTKTVAIVRDGTSWMFDEFVERFVAELGAIVGHRYKLKIKDEFDGGWYRDRIESAVRRATNDPEVDLVCAAGVLATRIASRMKESERVKPVIGASPEVVPSSDLGISRDGTSEIANYNFVTTPRRLERDLEMLKRLSRADRLHLLVDRKLLEGRDGPAILDRFEKLLDVELVPIVVGASARGALAKIPDDVEALYVVIPVRMPDAERKELYDGLSKRKVITLAMFGRRDVELGALAGLSPEIVDTLARRMALNAYQIFSGVSPNDLPVYLPVEDRLVINARTATAIGYSPNYETALAAEFIERTDVFRGEELTLEKAMNIAAEMSSKLRTSEIAVDVAREQEKVIRSPLLPQVGLLAGYGRAGFSDQETIALGEQQIELTPGETAQVSYGLKLTQILYDDEVISSYRAASRNVASRSLEAYSVKLDAMEQAAIAFLDLLSARALYEVEKENLRLTLNNLEMAKIRHAIGATDLQEVFRWEGDVAERRAAVIDREAVVDSSTVILNRVLGTERAKRWNPIDVPLKEDEFYFLDEELGESFNDRIDRVWAFGRFAQKFAVENSPELHSFDELLEGQGILLRERRRRFYLPKVNVEATVTQAHSDSDISDPSDENEWALGVRAILPLFQGGKRVYDLSLKAAEIRRIESQRTEALQFIEQRVLTAFNGFWGKHPAIRLSRRALESAQKNYESVQVKYTQGAADLLDLLDAQDSLLKKDQNASTAVHRYLAELIRLERAMSWLEHTKTEEEKRQFVRSLRGFESGGDTGAR